MFPRSGRGEIKRDFRRPLIFNGSPRGVLLGGYRACVRASWRPDGRLTSLPSLIDVHLPRKSHAYSFMRRHGTDKGVG